MLQALANDIRFLSVDQIARACFDGQPHSVRQAMRLTRRLAKSGWVSVHRVLARPVQKLRLPLFVWQHTQPAPDFNALAKRLHQRAKTAATVTTIVVATYRTRVLLGDASCVPSIKLTQTTHDLHVSEIYLFYRERGLGANQRWVSEDRLPLSWPLRQRPDALLVNGSGHFLRAVEYGGDYSTVRLRALHYGLASLPLAYEIW